MIGHLASLECDNLPTVLGSNKWLQRVTTSSLRQQKPGLRVRLVKVTALFSLGPKLFRGCGPLGMTKGKGRSAPMGAGCRIEGIVTHSAWAYIDLLTLVEGACAGTRS